MLVTFVFLESNDGSKPIQDCGFFLFGTGYLRLLVVVVYLIGASWRHRSLLYSFAFDGLAVRGFYVFLEFSAAFFYGFIFLGF